MKPRVLIIVTGDPRKSPRPAEAIRIAAGVGTWERAEVAVYLRGEAIRALAESPTELIEEEGFAGCWPLLVDFRQKIYAQKDAAELRELGEPAAPFKQISDDELAELAAAQQYVLRF